MQKTQLQQSEQFVGDGLQLLVKDLQEIDTVKESANVRKNLFKRHGIELGKRDEPETEFVEFEPVQGGKRAKVGEKYDNVTEFFTLEN